MHRGSDGYWVQDAAWESLPACQANAAEIERRRRLAEALGLPRDLVDFRMSDDEIEVAASLYRIKLAAPFRTN